MQPWGLQTQGYREEYRPILQCEMCQEYALELYVCSACYRAGHKDCLMVELVGEYAFCNPCSMWAIEQYSHQVAEIQRSRWRTRLARQMAAWTETAMTTTEVAGTLGLAIGSGVAMVGHGTAAFIKGTIEGITSASSAEPSGAHPELVDRPRASIGDGEGSGVSTSETGVSSYRASIAEASGIQPDPVDCP